MEFREVIAKINEQEAVPTIDAQGKEYVGRLDSKADAAWDELLGLLKSLDRRSIGNHFCGWSTPNTLSFGHQTVSLDYPILGSENDWPRVLIRFSQTLEPKPPVKTLWAETAFDTKGRFAWKISGMGVEPKLLGSSHLAGLIVERLHLAETDLLLT